MSFGRMSGGGLAGGFKSRAAFPHVLALVFVPVKGPA